MRLQNNLTKFLNKKNILCIIIFSIIIVNCTKHSNEKRIDRGNNNEIVRKDSIIIQSVRDEAKENVQHIDSLEIKVFPDSIRDRICYAYKNGRYDIFETLIKQGIDFNNRLDINHITVLMQIARTLSSSLKTKCKIMQLLIDNGADVNITNKHGKTALSYSIFPEISEILIENGADIEIKDSGGNTALIRSRSWPHSQVLIKNGAYINAQNNSGYSYLMFAVKYLDLENIKFLINNGADIFAVDGQGRNILMYSNKSEVTEYLINLGLNVNSFDHKKRTPLHYAISELSRNKNNVEILMKYGADINAKNWRGTTPIIISVKFGIKEITKLLIEKGVEFDRERIFIQFAKANKFDEDLAYYLFEQGVEINYQDSNGKTALIHAVERGSIETINFLIEQDAEINIRDNNGQSAIFYTVGFPSRKKALELLILHGADVNIKNKGNKTPLYYAKTNCDSSIVNILVNNGAK